MLCGSLFFRTTACKNINVLLLLLLPQHIIPLLLRKGGTHNFRRPQKRTEMKVVAPYRVRKPSWLFSVLLPLKDLARSSCRLSNYYKSNFFESKHSNREEVKFKEHLPSMRLGIVVKEGNQIPWSKSFHTLLTNGHRWEDIIPGKIIIKRHIQIRR